MHSDGHGHDRAFSKGHGSGVERGAGVLETMESSTYALDTGKRGQRKVSGIYSFALRYESVCTYAYTDLVMLISSPSAHISYTNY